MWTGADSCLQCSRKRHSRLADTAFLRDVILDRYGKMDGKTYGLAIGMLFDGEIERYEIATIKRNTVNIVGRPLEIIETRAVIDKNCGRIEMPSFAKYNLTT